MQHYIFAPSSSFILALILALILDSLLPELPLPAGLRKRVGAWVQAVGKRSLFVQRIIFVLMGALIVIAALALLRFLDGQTELLAVVLMALMLKLQFGFWPIFERVQTAYKDLRADPNSDPVDAAEGANPNAQNIVALGHTFNYRFFSPLVLALVAGLPGVLGYRFICLCHGACVDEDTETGFARAATLSHHIIHYLPTQLLVALVWFAAVLRRESLLRLRYLWPHVQSYDIRDNERLLVLIATLLGIQLEHRENTHTNSTNTPATAIDIRRCSLLLTLTFVISSSLLVLLPYTLMLVARQT